jgi:hypothetical protein
MISCYVRYIGKHVKNAVVLPPFTGINLKQRCWFMYSKETGVFTSSWSVVGQSYSFYTTAPNGLHRLVAMPLRWLSIIAWRWLSLNLLFRMVRYFKRESCVGLPHQSRQ